MVPDPEGIFERDNQRYRVEGTRGGGGVGLIQLNVLSSGPDGVVADVRYFLTNDPLGGAHRASGNDALVGDVGALGDFWVAPATLANLTPGFDGRTRITRGTAQVNGQTMNVVSIATSGPGSYVSETYDLGSGLLMFAGTMHSSQGTSIVDDDGQVTDHAGSVAYSHRRFLGVRRLSVPWVGQPAPGWVTVGRVSDYQGETRVESTGPAALPPLGGQAMAVSQVFERQVGTAMIGRQVVRAATTAGLPPTETTTPRAFGSAQFDGMWVPPAALASLRPQDVLDQDPYTGHVTYFGGVSGGFALIVVQSQADHLEHYYDVNSGLLAFLRYRVPSPGVGTQVTELQLAGQP